VTATRDPSPLANAAFARLFTAQIVALVGTGLSTVALTLLAFELAGANAGIVLGTALAVKMLAYVFFAPVIGGLAHRLPHKPLLVTMDLCRALLVVALPLVNSIWQIYLLIFLINLMSAGFKPVFQAIIPSILHNEAQYTRALSLSRIAYDLESLASPLLATGALLLLSYDALFIGNGAAFVISALLIIATRLPGQAPAERSGGIFQDISFGVRAYWKTPRLRALLVLYLTVASASAMIIVNTVVYVQGVLGGRPAQTSLALAAAGSGSMLTALLLPRLLRHAQDRDVMLAGSGLLALGLASLAAAPDYGGLLVAWLVLGVGTSLVQTPAGRLLVRSSAEGDRPAYFSAQFALSHACWLIAYPVAGQLGAHLGIPASGAISGVAAALATLLAWALWPKADRPVLAHEHSAVAHRHVHRHDDTHHDHHHDGWEDPEPHSHPHSHQPLRHAHAFVIDQHHQDWPR
jgi:MFS family permease